MPLPDYPGQRIDELGPLSGQVRTLHSGSNANELATVWNSILMTWFPPNEEYQIRLNHQEDWVDVYVLRNARAPEESAITINPVFMVRCFNPRPRSPLYAAELNANKSKAPKEIADFCESIGAAIRPAYMAFAHRNRVRLIQIRWETDRRGQMALDHFSRISCRISLEGDIPRHLDHVKAHFAEQWGYPYSEYWDESSSDEDTD